jgi:hypothetical protein
MAALGFGKGGGWTWYYIHGNQKRACIHGLASDG